MEYIEFVDELPEFRGPYTDTRKGWGWDIAPVLRENPGKWGIIFTSESRTLAVGKINMIRGRSKTWHPKGAYEAAQRRRASDGAYIIYARYVGSNDE